LFTDVVIVKVSGFCGTIVISVPETVTETPGTCDAIFEARAEATLEAVLPLR
jgi:hypothetical protein